MQAFLVNSFLFAAVTFNQCAKAQLVGCEAVDCPADGCVIGDTTNLDLGIANFTSSLSPDQSLSWTVGLADIPHHNAVNDTWLKSYYLGTPPSLNLDEKSGISGCAIFFENSGTFQFNTSAPETSVGTCQDALTATCVDDLIAQAANITTTLTSSGTATGANQSTFCSQLGPALNASMPASCRTIGLDQVPIVAKELTGSNSSIQPVQQTNCTLTTGGLGYNVGLVATESFQHFFATRYVSQFIFGVTPILTLFYPSGETSGKNSTILQQPEAHLTCVKIIEPGASDAHGPTLLNAAPQSAPQLYSFLSLWAILALVFVAF